MSIRFSPSVLVALATGLGRIQAMSAGVSLASLVPTTDEPYLYLEPGLLAQLFGQAGTTDSLLAYRLGQELVVEQLGLMGLVLQNCDHLGQAIQKLERYLPLSSDLSALEHHVLQQAGEVVLKFQFHPELEAHTALLHQLMLLELAYLTHGLQQLSQDSDLWPKTASVPIELADQLRGQCRFPLTTGPLLSLTYEADVLMRSIPHGNAILRQQLELVASQWLHDLPEGKQWSLAVKQQLIRLLDSQKPSASTVACALNTTVRGLQRKLQQEGTTYQSLVDDTRCQLAKQYLQQDLTVNEVAYLLGYEVPAAFTTAFKQWTGVSPSGFRAGNKDLS